MNVLQEYESGREEQDQKNLALQMEHFITHWRPADAYDARRFEQETYFLFQRAQAVAQQPLVRRMASALALAPMPMPPPLIKDPKS